MAAVNFLYRSTKDEAYLSLRLLYSHNTISYVFEAKTKLKVSKTYWNEQHKKTNFKTSSDIEIINEIHDIKKKQNKVIKKLNKIEKYVLKAFNSEDPETVTKEWLVSKMDFYYSESNKENEVPKDLISYIDCYIKRRTNEISNSTLKKIKSNKQLLIRFEAYRNETILIKNVNDDFKTEFVNYCIEQLYAQNTIQRAFAFIKTYCKHARYSGIKTHSQLDSLRVDRQKVPKIYLTIEELNKIENISKDKLTDSLENAKDWLIISCYTGQRISDFMRFTKEQLIIEDGRYYLEFTQQKTGNNMSIPVHPKVIEILNRRDGSFPYRISDQKYNDFIKVVCKLAGLNEKVKGSKLVETGAESGVFRKKTGTYEKWELITSHIGRRSLATNFYGKIPTSYLINMTGHSTEVLFLSYIQKRSKDTAKETFKYF